VRALRVGMKQDGVGRCALQPSVVAGPARRLGLHCRGSSSMAFWSDFGHLSAQQPHGRPSHDF
jgi:hypothetical protein